MPWFRVTIRKVQYRRALINVEAASKKEAKALALKTVRVGNYTLINSEVEALSVEECGSKAKRSP